MASGVDDRIEAADAIEAVVLDLAAEYSLIGSDWPEHLLMDFQNELRRRIMLILRRLDT